MGPSRPKLEGGEDHTPLARRQAEQPTPLEQVVDGLAGPPAQQRLDLLAIQQRAEASAPGRSLTRP
ncbi:MAG: hypothetical protein H0V51_24070 [Chloroflexi bacterium]|nr:hypothetical protein [Chloroflexota bacterium]